MKNLVHVVATTMILGVLLAGSSVAYADMYAGPYIRIVSGVHNASGTVFTFGGEYGWEYVGFGIRYGYRSNTHHLYPDLRFGYKFDLPANFAITPLFEISPAFYAASVAGASIKTFEFIVRPGVRVGWSPTELISVFLEPFLMDLGVYRVTSVGGTVTKSSTVTVSYTVGLGASFKF